MQLKILVAGAGRLGSRYLQGLASANISLDIWVFDVSPESLSVAERRFNEVNAIVKHTTSYTTKMSELPKRLDFAIVATNADVRVDLIEALVTRSAVRFWILEKWLAQSVADLSRLSSLLKVEKAWVNTPRHQWKIYRRLCSSYPDRPPVDVRVDNLPGLICNAIHFVDFVCRWSHARLIAVDTSGLRTDWYESKRLGFYESNGQLKMIFSDGSHLSLSTEHDNLPFSISLKIGEQEWMIDESNGLAVSADGKKIDGSAELQSELTAPTIRAILSGASCGLPSLAESVQQHRVMLDALTSHWNAHMPSGVGCLPIT